MLYSYMISCNPKCYQHIADMFLIIFFALFATSSAFLQQSVGVKGQLLCGNEPLAGAKVKLINHNTIGMLLMTMITISCTII